MSLTTVILSDYALGMYLFITIIVFPIALAMTIYRRNDREIFWGSTILGFYAFLSLVLGGMLIQKKYGNYVNLLITSIILIAVLIAYPFQNTPLKSKTENLIH